MELIIIPATEEYAEAAGALYDKVVYAIAEEEKIEVSEEEIQTGIDNYAAALGYPSREAFLEAYTEDDVRLSLVMNKAIDLVRENAVVTVVSPEEAEAVTEADEAVTEAATE